MERKETREKIKVGILGATGTVGQRFISLLTNHPLFKVECLGASSNSCGKSYEVAAHWLLPTSIPDEIAKMTVRLCDDTEAFKDCKVIFSALDSNVATELENKYRSLGKAVFSNAKNHRYDSDVPIMVASVNKDHMKSIQKQKLTNGNGFIVTNPNCSTTGVVVALRPIQSTFGIKEVVVFTMQSISGAGYPGVPSLDILGNVIPYIGEEEEKIEIETKKILGEWNGEQFLDNKMMVSAHTNRVPVAEGHTICLSIKLDRPATPQQVESCLKSFHEDRQDSTMLIDIPPIHVSQGHNRPQPKLDLERGQGLTVTIGRVREGSCQNEGSSFDIRITLLVHNTVLGAAGSSIQNAELAFKLGLL